MPQNKRTLAFKKLNCNTCKLADRAKIRQGRPACKVFNDTGHWPEVKNGHCQAREDVRGKREMLKV